MISCLGRFVNVLYAAFADVYDRYASGTRCPGRVSLVISIRVLPEPGQFGECPVVELAR